MLGRVPDRSAKITRAATVPLPLPPSLQSADCLPFWHCGDEVQAAFVHARVKKVTDGGGNSAWIMAPAHHPHLPVSPVLLASGSSNST